MAKTLNDLGPLVFAKQGEGREEYPAYLVLSDPKQDEHKAHGLVLIHWADRSSKDREVVPLERVRSMEESSTGRRSRRAAPTAAAALVPSAKKKVPVKKHGAAKHPSFRGKDLAKRNAKAETVGTKKNVLSKGRKNAPLADRESGSSDEEDFDGSLFSIKAEGSHSASTQSEVSKRNAIRSAKKSSSKPAHAERAGKESSAKSSQKVDGQDRGERTDFGSNQTIGKANHMRKEASEIKEGVYLDVDADAVCDNFPENPKHMKKVVGKTARNGTIDVEAPDYQPGKTSNHVDSQAGLGDETGETNSNVAWDAVGNSQTIAKHNIAAHASTKATQRRDAPSSDALTAAPQASSAPSVASLSSSRRFPGSWKCEHCAFVNEHRSGSNATCEKCRNRRQMREDLEIANQRSVRSCSSSEADSEIAKTDWLPVPCAGVKSAIASKSAITKRAEVSKKAVSKSVKAFQTSGSRSDEASKTTKGKAEASKLKGSKNVHKAVVKSSKTVRISQIVAKKLKPNSPQEAILKQAVLAASLAAAATGFGGNPQLLNAAKKSKSKSSSKTLTPKAKAAAPSGSQPVKSSTVTRQLDAMGQPRQSSTAKKMPDLKVAASTRFQPAPSTVNKKLEGTRQAVQSSMSNSQPESRKQQVADMEATRLSSEGPSIQVSASEQSVTKKLQSLSSAASISQPKSPEPHAGKAVPNEAVSEQIVQVKPSTEAVPLPAYNATSRVPKPSNDDTLETTSQPRPTAPSTSVSKACDTHPEKAPIEPTKLLLSVVPESQSLPTTAIPTPEAAIVSKQAILPLPEAGPSAKTLQQPAWKPTVATGSYASSDVSMLSATKVQRPCPSDSNTQNGLKQTTLIPHLGVASDEKQRSQSNASQTANTSSGGQQISQGKDNKAVSTVGTTPLAHPTNIGRVNRSVYVEQDASQSFDAMKVEEQCLASHSSAVKANTACSKSGIVSGKVVIHLSSSEESDVETTVNNNHLSSAKSSLEEETAPVVNMKPEVEPTKSLCVITANGVAPSDQAKAPQDGSVKKRARADDSASEKPVGPPPKKVQKGPTEVNHSISTTRSNSDTSAQRLDKSQSDAFQDAATKFPASLEDLSKTLNPHVVIDTPSVFETRGASEIGNLSCDEHNFRAQTVPTASSRLAASSNTAAAGLAATSASGINVVASSISNGDETFSRESNMGVDEIKQPIIAYESNVIDRRTEPQNAAVSSTGISTQGTKETVTEGLPPTENGGEKESRVLSRDASDDLNDEMRSMSISMERPRRQLEETKSDEHQDRVLNYARQLFAESDKKTTTALQIITSIEGKFGVSFTLKKKQEIINFLRDLAMEWAKTLPS